MKLRLVGTGRKWKATVLAASWFLLLTQGLALPAAGQESAEEDPQAGPVPVLVQVTSDPSGQAIILNDETLEETTPADLKLIPGPQTLVVNADGYQPLTHEILLRAGEDLALNFILLETPPEPPSQEELRSLSPTGEISGENVAEWRRMENRATQKARMVNNSCLDCHNSLTRLQFNGGHKPLVCEECHDSSKDHVKDGKVAGKMSVIRGDGIQNLCLMCHDRDNRSVSWSHARTVALPDHLEKQKVDLDNRCEQCHHVHDPMKWVIESREMVGLPFLMRSQPLMSEDMAGDRREIFTSLSETFLVFPTAPGFLGIVSSSSSDEFPAEILFLGGLALMGASLLVGKYFHSKDVASIRAVNTEIAASNDRIKIHNELVKKAMTDYNSAISL